VAAVAPALIPIRDQAGVEMRASEAYNGGMASFDDTRPTRLRGDYDQSVSRWLWLVKWLLLIPHFIVLFFLYIARFVVTIIAFFAILFTGRYPRALFDFSVGVLRWSWRVRFYGYGALGTDKYPPFSLKSNTDYPADLDIDYPERLSRGLVLIKWWLLAIPHYLILAAILTGALFAGAGGRHHHHYHQHYHHYFHGPAGISLFAILLLIVIVALLFAGRYPRGLFDLILGINRWIYRVHIYASLMRDEYPPFRLDQGPTEPVSGPTGGGGAGSTHPEAESP
jgi:Domain of unknown function (DUF4389)